ncbi:MAG TPA: hypothetical protein EYH26_03820 [Pyrodictium sp.]|nr:hypothetical protein [Pyrodictium sp.]
MFPYLILVLLLLLVGLDVLLLLFYARIWRRVVMLEKQFAYSLQVVRQVVKQYSIIARALASALASYEAEKALEKLRRKRRRRYIAFIVVAESGKPPEPQEMEKAILDAVKRVGGEIAVADARPRLVYYDPLRGLGIVSASHTTKYIVLAALGIVRYVNRRKVLVIPVRTTGTIKRAKKALQTWR